MRSAAPPPAPTLQIGLPPRPRQPPAQRQATRDERRGRPDAGTEPLEAPDPASALDLLISDAAPGVFRRFLPNPSTVRFAAGLARRPATVARRGAWLAGELARVMAGRSAIAPAAKDRRFADSAWKTNPWLARAVQAYLAAASTIELLLADARDRRPGPRAAGRQRDPARVPRGRFVADAEAIYSYEGTREVNTLIVGRAITGTGAFV